MVGSSLARRIPGRRWWPFVLALGIGLAGYFGPWVPHRAAGLVILGLDLGEYAKFLPQVMSGEVAVAREMFYLPLFAASVSASLLASRLWSSGAMGRLRTWGRVLLALAAVPIALAMLPPAWSPATLLAAEFRWQVIAIGICLLFAVLSPLLRYLPHRLILALIAILALAAAIAPVWGFLRIQPSIARLYGHPLPLGWGFWANLVGYFGLALIAVAEMIRRR